MLARPIKQKLIRTEVASHSVAMSTPPESVAFPSTPATSFADIIATAITDLTNHLSYICYNCNNCFLIIPITSTSTATASPTSFLCPHCHLIPHHIISPPLSPPSLPSLPSPSPPALLAFSPQSLNSAPLCSICMELLETQNDSDTSTTVTILPCQHYFHRCCISRWYNNSRTCPMCRRQFSLDSAVLAPEEEAVRVMTLIEEILRFILSSGSLTAAEEVEDNFDAMVDEDGDILMVDEDGDIPMVDA